MRRIISRWYILIFCFFITGTTLGQTAIKTSQADNDSLFNAARKSAFEGKRAMARSICFYIVKHNAAYFDAWVLIGRTYTWDNQYDSARLAFNEVLSREKGYYDAHDALIDLEYWTDHYQACSIQCDVGLSFHQNDRNFRIKKAKALIALKQFDEATLLLKDIVKLDSVNQDASMLLDAIRLANIKNKVTLNYSYEYFEKRMIAPWHMAYLQYSRKTSLGTVIGRLNYANRFNAGGLQFEADAYPKLTKSSYLYLNLGYSEKFIFPHFRSGFELYKKLPSAFESSLGFRYLSFTSSGVFIYTASLGKYTGNYWLSARTFITPGKTGTSVSGMLMARKYFADEDNYLGMRLSYGTSPDDRKELLTSTDILRVKSKALRFEYNKKLKQVWIVNIAGVYEDEEYYPAKFRYVLTGDITISLLF